MVELIKVTAEQTAKCTEKGREASEQQKRRKKKKPQADNLYCLTRLLNPVDCQSIRIHTLTLFPTTHQINVEFGVSP
jgi:hypothetical protein